MSSLCLVAGYLGDLLVYVIWSDANHISFSLQFMLWIGWRGKLGLSSFVLMLLASWKTWTCYVPRRRVVGNNEVVLICYYKNYLSYTLYKRHLGRFLAWRWGRSPIFPVLAELQSWQKSEPNSYIITSKKDRQTACLVVGGKICRRDGRHLVGEKVQENPTFPCGY